MTAQVVLMNRYGIAAASDSATTTFSDTTVSIANGATKLFRLSSYHPVGVACHGNVHFMGAPWPSIIAMYREQLGARSFPRLGDYKADFLRWLESKSEFCSDTRQRDFIFDAATDYTKQVSEMLGKSNRSPAAIRRLLRADQILVPRSSRIAVLSDAKAILGRYRAFISRVVEEEFDSGSLTAELRRALALNSAMHCVQSIGSGARPATVGTGLAFVGFGNDDLLPGCIHVHVRGICADRIHHATIREDHVDDDTHASIVTLGTDLSMRGFLEGICPGLQGILVPEFAEGLAIRIRTVVTAAKGNKPHKGAQIVQEVDKRLKAKTERALRKRFQELSQRLYFDQALATVQNLLVDDLSSLARHLIEVEYFRGFLLGAPGYVGGDVKVMTITRSDGLRFLDERCGRTTPTRQPPPVDPLTRSTDESCVPTT